jgi:hypothetical protein
MIHKNHLYISLITLITVTSASLQTVPVAAVLRTKDKKCVLLCGDMHTARLDDASEELVKGMDGKHVPLLKQLVKTLKESDQPSACILELSPDPDYHEELLYKYKNLPSQRDCMNSLQYQAVRPLKNPGNLRFFTSDVRMVTNAFTTIINDIGTHKKLFLSSQQGPALQTKYKTTFKGYSFAAFLNEARARIDLFKKLMTNFKDLPEEAVKYINQHVNELEMNIASLEKLIISLSLEGSDIHIMEDDLVDILLDSLVNPHNNKMLEILMDPELQNSLTTVSIQVGDLGFIYDFLEIESNYNIIPVYTGLAHMRCLDSFLATLGYTKLEKIDNGPNLTKGFVMSDITRLPIPVTTMENMIKMFLKTGLTIKNELVESKTMAEKTK